MTTLTGDARSSHAFVLSLSAALMGALILGCGGAADGSEDLDDSEGDSGEAAASCRVVANEGKRLFEQETFGGNGRTCLTCHSRKTGTLSPGEAQARFLDDPADPLFYHDGSDDFEGHGATRMLAHATVLVRMKLPPGVTLTNDPAATTIVVRRGIPSTINSPALDPVIMLDGRGTSLTGQARGAIKGHAQAVITPTDAQLQLIVDHEKSQDFFSSEALWAFAQGGPPPALPQGHTAAQKRGRAWFEDAPVALAVNAASPRKGLCAVCHSGPMLNETNGKGRLAALGIPQGTRRLSAGVSELNAANNPVFAFTVPKPDGTTFQVQSPDPGVALLTGDFTSAPTGDLGRFKIPSLWGVRHTAPYFHDNSRKTLQGAIDHYAAFFAVVTAPTVDGDPALVMTPQDKSDLLAFLKLL